MERWQPKDPDWEARVRDSFARQRAMSQLQARLSRVAPGEIEIAAPFLEEWTQQHGFLHAGMTTTLLDTACGFAALSLMPAEAGVLAVDFHVNLMRPASADLRVCGTVLKPGKTLNICRGEAWIQRDGREILVAAMQSTVMTVTGRDDVRD
ncbi:MAG TPA: PaaI family thioesterase [bacterium]|nr:PaaI family thioesterase [bacterium]